MDKTLLDSPSKRREVDHSKEITKLQLGVIFVLTFLSYVSLHMTRKSFSNVKNAMSDDPNLRFSNGFLGTLDTVFLAFYAAGLYLSGIIGDRFRLRHVLAVGMFFSGVVTCLFALGGVWGISSHAYYITMWALNGLIQSAGWPTVVAIMGNWYGHTTRGMVFGVWSANASVGNIIGASVTSAVLGSAGSQHWSYALMSSCCVIFPLSFVVFFFLHEHPHEIGLRSPNDPVREDGDLPHDDDFVHESDQKPLPFLQAFRIPGVMIYGCAYACLKMVNYAMFNWLPTYLTEDLKLGDDTSGYVSNIYDGTQIFGGFLAGGLSDRMRVRSPVCVMFMLVAAVSLGFFRLPVDGEDNKKALIYVLIGIAGFFVGGPANLISSAISADLGTHSSIAGNAKALATVAGIVDGTGSVGASSGQAVIGALSDAYGWTIVFWILLGMLLASCLCLSELFIRDMKFILRRRRASSSSYDALLKDGQ